ncbi:Leucine-rich repeat domain superfamily [Sesbania bispinosa]|nr:Leucine-rich repeat domain superfamily [Sesbania bispinosa]
MKKRESENKEDRLSDLPDCVLTHLMSFMPTKDIVRTCIFSRRWKDLWKRVPSLTLHSSYSRVRQITTFNNFVLKVLSLRDDSVPLRYLDFHHIGRVPPQLLERILEYVVSHSVEQIKLHANCDPDLPLPPCLFSCQTLTSLDLSIERGCPVVLLPRSLNLTTVWNSSMLRISNATLVNLSIVASPFHLDNYKVMLSTPNLRSFSYSGIPSRKIYADNLSRIKEVLANVRSLTLCSNALEDLSTIPDLLNTEAPCFGHKRYSSTSRPVTRSCTQAHNNLDQSPVVMGDMENLAVKLEAFMEQMATRQRALEEQMAELSVTVRRPEKGSNGDGGGNGGSSGSSDDRSDPQSKGSMMGFVEEYQRQFQSLLSRTSDLKPHQQVDLFTAGLVEELRIDIEMQQPGNLGIAMNMARALERKQRVSQGTPISRTSMSWPSSKNTSNSYVISANRNSNARGGGQTTKPVGSSSRVGSSAPFVERLTRAEMAERRAKGLCYNCDESYSTGHKCNRLFWIEVPDDESE